MDPTGALLRDIEDFIVRKGMTPTAFGRKAAGDPRFVFSIRSGRELRRATRERIERYMQNERIGAVA